MRPLLVLAVIALGSCGPVRPVEPEQPVPPTPPARIVATERGPGGGTLVVVAETGERMADLTAMGPVAVRDNSPAFSPDGAWVAFASTRGRADLLHTSIWLVGARPGEPPRRLTTDDAVDRDPAWTADGRSVVFSSDRGGSFDLWQLELAPDAQGRLRAAGPARQLTDAPGHELRPAVRGDGLIVYMHVDPDAGTSRLWTVPLAGGAPAALTAGPTDATPTWSPDGATVAFAARAEGRADADLHVVNADGEDRRVLFDEPLSDQTGPVWSPDGRYLFATSVFRSQATGKPILSSITVLDLREKPPVLRALHDPVGAQVRSGAAVGPVILDATAIHRNAVYADALRATIASELRRRQDALER